MPTGFNSGFGTGEEDELFETEGQAAAALSKFLKEKGVGQLPPTKDPEGRVVTYRGETEEGKSVVVTVRTDLKDPNLKKGGSIDTKTKVGGTGETKHFGFRKR